MLDLQIGGVPEHFNLPWHLAIEDKLFEAEGLRLNWQNYGGGTGAMVRDLHENKLDIAILLTEGAVADIIKGGNHRILSLYVESPLVWGIHVHNEANYQHASQIEGATYAISRYGSGSHLMAVVDTQLRNWNTQNMKFEEVGNIEGAREALANNEADVFMWEKYMTMPLVEGGEWRRIGERPTPWPSFVICVREDVMNKHPDLAERLLKPVIKSAQQLKTQPNAAEIIARRYDLKPHNAAEWLSQVKWLEDRYVPTATLAEVVEALASVNLISEQKAAPDLCFKQTQLV
jgi:ABC-type nitrate/sulfonate/bicarbonate transport system substrate-binding protein